VASPEGPVSGAPDSGAPGSGWSELERALAARGLVLAGNYERVVRASLVRVWENVFDWEHLPWLHSQSFRRVELKESGPWGWRIEAVLAGGREPRASARASGREGSEREGADRARRAGVVGEPGTRSGTDLASDSASEPASNAALDVASESRPEDRAAVGAGSRAERRADTRNAAKAAQSSVTIELRAERELRRYVSATLAGPGAGTEIWTRLDVIDAEATAVHVEFWLPGFGQPAGSGSRATLDTARMQRVGQGLSRTYAELWDQDEAMMQARTRALVSRAEHTRANGGAVGADRVACDLGPLEALRARIPLDFELAGDPHRLIECDGVLIAYSRRCPHMLGPLAEEPGCQGVVRCPWHGYAFDVRSGASLDGHAIGLWRAEVEVDPETGHLLVRRPRRYRRSPG